MHQADETNEVATEVVACSTWSEFVSRCADDLTRGGMFLRTEIPHRVWSFIDVVLGLPAGHQVVLRGRVVHVVDLQRAAAKGMAPGIGVEFVQLDGPRLIALNQLLHYARTEGCLDQPRFTFAQWLAQNADFQPPGQIMASLPPPPSTQSSQPPAAQEPRRRRTDRPDVARPMRSATGQSAVRRRAGTGNGAVTQDGASGGVARDGGSTRSSARPGATGRRTGEAAATGTGARRATHTTTRPQARTSTRPQPGRSMTPASGTLPATAASMPSTSGTMPAAAQSMPPASGSMPPAGQAVRPSQAPANGAAASTPPEPPHPTRSPDALKLGMTHVAHRRYKEAQVVFRQMLDEDAADIDAQRWIHIACGREAIAAGKDDIALGFYRKVLSVDPANREARDKVANLQRNAKLANLPFGRFFAKK